MVHRVLCGGAVILVEMDGRVHKVNPFRWHQEILHLKPQV